MLLATEPTNYMLEAKLRQISMTYGSTRSKSKSRRNSRHINLTEDPNYFEQRNLSVDRDE